jgi:hypothetical protein
MEESKLNLQEPMTDWDNEPQLSQLKAEFTGAKQTHDTFMENVRRWKKIKNISTNNATKVKGFSNIQPKTARKHLEWRLPKLSEPFLNKKDLFSIKPRTFEDVNSARQNELVLNYQFDNKIDKVAFIDEFVRRNVEESICITKTLWERETEIQIVTKPMFSLIEPSSEEELLALQDAVELFTQNNNAFRDLPEELQFAAKQFLESGIPMIGVISGSEEIEEEVILENKPVVEIVNPDNFYIDPNCGKDFNKAMFCIYSFESSITELNKTGKYVNLENINLENNTPLADAEHLSTTLDNSFSFKDKARKKFVVYEYWGFYDINNDGHLKPILVSWVGDVIIRMEESPFPLNKLPFVISSYMPDIDSVYGDSDLELLEDSQKVIGALTRAMINQIGKSAASQTGMPKNYLDPIQKEKYISGQDYEYDAAQLPPQQAIYQHDIPVISPTTFSFLQQQNAEAESITGTKTYNEGLNASSLGSVATAVKGTLNAASERESSILRRLEDAIQEIGKNIIAMNHIFLAEEEVIRITNDEFVTIRREDLQGFFDVKVDINSPEANEKKAADLAFLLQTIGPNMDININMRILAHIAKLKNIPDLEEEFKNFKVEPTPEERQMQQLELQKVQLEVDKLRSEIKLNEAKALKEESEARSNILNDELDATGVKHERELAKQQAQAHGNQELEITKTLAGLGDVETAIGYNQMSKESN